MRYISTFSGVEATTLAWAPLGWEAVAFSEVEQFCNAVLAARFPDVPNLGDIREVDWSGYHGAVDVVAGGSPCQSFSVAGNRTGLEGASGLMWEFVRCVRDVRPRWLVWENVPGALSSAKGEDFRCLLASLDELGYGLAWRVLDAQFWGVPQRRRRVFLVGSLGDVRGPGAVLLEPCVLRGDFKTGRKAREAVARASGRHAAREGGRLNPHAPQSMRVYAPGSVSPTLCCCESGPGNVPAVLAFKYHQSAGARSLGITEDGSPTLTADWHVPAVAWKMDNLANSACGDDEDAVGTLSANVGMPPFVAYVVRTANTGANGCGIDAETAHTLDRGVPEAVCYAANQRGEVRLMGGDGSIRGAITASRGNGKEVQFVSDHESVLRRFTPRECERLQGMPDDWTRIPWRGKPEEECPDTPRYQAIGNSMAVPVMHWIGRRIAMVEEGLL